MKWNMVIGALVVSASLCAQSFAGDPSCGNKCCKPLFSGLASYFNCRFPCGPPLVIKPITLHHRCK